MANPGAMCLGGMVGLITLKWLSQLDVEHHQMEGLAATRHAVRNCLFSLNHSRKQVVLQARMAGHVYDHGHFAGNEVYVLVCVSWTFFCSLMRSSLRHGYTVTVVT